MLLGCACRVVGAPLLLRAIGSFGALDNLLRHDNCSAFRCGERWHWHAQGGFVDLCELAFLCVKDPATGQPPSHTQCTPVRRRGGPDEVRRCGFKQALEKEGHRAACAGAASGMPRSPAAQSAVSIGSRALGTLGTSFSAIRSWFIGLKTSEDGVQSRLPRVPYGTPTPR